MTIIDGTTGIDKITDGSVVQADLASGVSSTGPAFSSYRTSNQSISANTLTKVAWNTERFDTNSNYDNTTNYRFTPTVAGYYLVNSVILIDGKNTGFVNNHIYKNGASYIFHRTGDNSTGDFGASVTALIYLNGTTDYIENYVRHNNSATDLLINTSELGEFSAHLVRAA